MEGVLAGEGASYLEDQRLPLNRSGFLEECFFTYSYSPVRGEDGTIEGVIVGRALYDGRLTPAQALAAAG